MQGVLRRRLQGVAVLVEIGAEHRHSGNLSKGVDESSTEAGQHVEVARTSLDEREEAGAVDTFATSQNGVEVGQVVDDEVECFQLAVAARIHEVHHANLVFHNVIDDVGLGKLFRRLFEECHNRIGIQNQVFVIHIIRVFSSLSHILLTKVVYFPEFTKFFALIQKKVVPLLRKTTCPIVYKAKRRHDR